MRISDWSSDVCSSDLHDWPVVSSSCFNSEAAEGFGCRMVLKRDEFVDISLGRNEETMDGLGLSCSGFYLSGKTFDCFGEAVHVPSLRRRGSAHSTEERRVGKEGGSTWRSR